jgi:two-component system CheB/CheR fusion protein
LTNAIKFTPAGGTITITGQRDGEMCTLAIRDTGKGIPAERLTRIFERFHQLPGDPRAGGLGLGLALVHGIIELHDGAITADSSGPGQGSTFTVTLPALTQAAKPEETSAASIAPQNIE